MAGDFYFYTDEMSVGYDGKSIIEHIRIEVNKGEILTLIGPNGAGKSTILKSITQQLRIIAGTVYLDGRTLDGMSRRELAQKQAVVLTARMHPEMMTCRDVVGTGRYPYTGTLGLLGEEDKAKIQAALELVHAEDIAERDFEAISDGQRQRILLARAICQEPELIILDEPTSFLDIRHKLEFLGILHQMVREQNVAVIMSLHELDLAQKISDKVMCVHGPVIAKFGTPEEIFQEEFICELYGMQEGSYDAAFGCTELPPTPGDAQVFVIAGGGSGIPVYRQLQRQGIPFATGILTKNDVDYEAAVHLANEVIAEEAFEPVSAAVYEKAAAAMRRCGRVICPLQNFGSLNEMNRKLRDAAADWGILAAGCEDI